MTTPARVSHLTKIISISSIAVIGFGLSSCTSQSELDFAAQHGYKRSDYFGTSQNRNFVPVSAQKPEYYPAHREQLAGRPVH